MAVRSLTTLLLLSIAPGLTASCDRSKPAPTTPTTPTTPKPKPAWKLYSPTNPKPPDPEKKIRCVLLTLLQTEQVTGARTTVADLAAFLNAAEARLTEAIGAPTSTFNLRLTFSCKPDAFSLEIAYAGDVKPELLQKIHDAVTATPALKTTGDVAFQSDYDVHP